MDDDTRINKDIHLRDDRKVLISIRGSSKKLKIFGFNNSPHHISIYYDDLLDLVDTVGKEIKRLSTVQ